MGSKSQRKGRAGELELARLLQGCKRNERLNVPEAMAQAVRDAERFQDGAPTVFHRRNRSGWLVTQRLEDWIALYRKKEPPASHTDSDTSG